MRNILTAWLFVTAITTATGCASMSDVTRARAAGGGEARVYACDEARAWDASRGVIRHAGAESIEEHRPEHYMLATVGMGAFSYGTLIGTWIEPTSPGHTKVTVVTKRKNQVGAITDLTEGGFHEELAKKLATPQQAPAPGPPAAGEPQRQKRPGIGH